MDFPPVLAPISAELQRVDAVIRERLASDVALDYDTDEPDKVKCKS